ncbi:MAG: hypothetical protein H7061_10720 [Bdellovibrionaceae bacterium]|nr:hypothetical protein [Bdellovibrio sp.]
MLLMIVTVFYTEMTRADEMGWSQLSSDQIEIQKFASGEGEVLSNYPSLVQSLMVTFWNWDPQKELKKTTPRVIEREPFNVLQETIQNLVIHFDVTDSTHFRKAWFHLKPDLKVRGLFGFHDFKKKRPLIILRMGIHGNVDELLAERYLAKIIYEDLDANFLLLESLTSFAFLSQNKNISFGGIDEGLQTFVILKELNRALSPFLPITASFHLMGLSMGGHGTFVTALLDQFNGRKIKSILNLCPLINLEKTFDYHARDGFGPAFIDLWNARRMNRLFDMYPKEISGSQWWMTLFDLKPRFTPAVLQILNSQRKTPLLSVDDIEKIVPGMKWPKGFAEHLKNSKSFYDLNNFWSLYQGVKTPMGLISTPHDPLVTNEFNADMITKKTQPGDFSSLKMHVFDRGIHCGFAPVYQWDYVVDLVKDGLGL